MLLHFTKPANLLIVATVSLLFAVSSCKKMSSSDPNPPPPPPPADTTKHPAPADLSARVTASLSGFVTSTDQGAGGPVDGAIVSFGIKTAVTDEYGYFEIPGASVTSEAAQVTVSKPGFFTNYKTLMTEDGKANFIRLKLEHKIYFSRFTAASGVSFTLGDGGTISVPPNALTIAGTSTSYSGDVTIYGTRIDANSEDIAMRMPGDARALDTLQQLKLLSTFGIINFVAEGANGEKLKLSKDATITIPLFGTQPAAVDLWYYDETLGLWRQHGRGTQSSFKYTGTISRFGSWNFAVAENYVKVKGRLMSPSGEPVPFAYVNVSRPSTSSNAWPLWKFSDANGYINMAAPANSQLSFDVYGNLCNSPVFSQSLPTVEADIALGDISITGNNVVTVDATLTDCGNNGIPDGLLMMAFIGDNYRFPAGNDGKVHFNTVVCNYSFHQSAIFVAEQISSGQKSNMTPVELVAGNNDLGNFSVCGSSGQARITCKLVDNSGNPLSHVFIKIFAASVPGAVYTTISDAEGNVGSDTYENTDNTLSVYGSLDCNNPVFSTTFHTTNRDTSLGTFTVSSLITATVTGSVVDCNNSPVTSGHVILQKDQENYQYPVSSDGTFNFNIPICSATNPEPVSIIAENNATLQSGNHVAISLNSGTNSIGTLTACFDNTSSEEFLHYSVDNSYYSYVPPVNSFNQYVDEATHWNYIAGGNLVTGQEVFFAITGNISVGGPGISLDEFEIAGDYGRYSADPVQVNITEYGPVGGFIAGNFQLSVQSAFDQSIHNTLCNFRVKRNE